jgi:hypothetical protein
MVPAPALAEPTPPPTPKMAAALSPATYIPTEPQVQPRTPLTSCRNCQATFTSRNRLHKHLRFDCSSTTTKNAVKFTTSTSTTSSSSFLQSVDYVQQQITRHLNDLRLCSQHVYPLSNRQPKNTSLFSTSSLSSRATATFFYAPATIFLRVCEPPLHSANPLIFDFTKIGLFQLKHTLSFKSSRFARGSYLYFTPSCTARS